MIERIAHFALTAHPSVHDEEALTSLELAGRTAAKVNECIDDVNQQRTTLAQGLAAIPGAIEDSFSNKGNDGTLQRLVNETLYKSVIQRINAVDSRVNNIVTSGTPTDGNTELIDARTGADGTIYASVGHHLRHIANGKGLMDALRPGTIRHGRISAGMLMGELSRRYVIGEQWTTAGKWTGSGYVDPETLEVVEHASYQFTEPAPCEYGDTFRVYTAIYGNKIPAAIFYDEDKNIVGTSGGDIGWNDWEPRFNYVQVDREAAYVSFQCGTQGISAFRVLRYSPRMYPDPLEAMGGRGYIRAYAFKRSDTVTDRAQIKMWFKVEEGQSYRFRVEPLQFRNVSGWTLRFFAATSDSTYERSLNVTDSGRSYAASMALATDLTIPAHNEDEGEFTHLAVFIDLIPTNPDNRVDASIAPPTLHVWNGSEYIQTRQDPQNVELHGSVDGDFIATVPPGGMGSPLWRKTICIHGDSLTRGNTLPKAASWFNIGCASRDMNYWNDAVNGQAISDMPVSVDLEGLDYYVLQGGANDKRLNKPLDTFKQRIRDLVTEARKQSPKCKIMLMTNWRRTTDANALGLFDSDYVAAMLEVAEEMGVVCLNNYAYSLNLLDPNVAAWADEGIVTDGEKNIHFSREANKWLAHRFVAALENL